MTNHPSGRMCVGIVGVWVAYVRNCEFGFGGLEHFQINSDDDMEGANETERRRQRERETHNMREAGRGRVRLKQRGGDGEAETAHSRRKVNGTSPKW